ncbi:PREDICTED: protein terminal ear1 homolog [Tarenaya hassleriana]|uniref:protein terminal ear1 homolog n=1 Tax=Tarenaya hassleriana TaxID=28532 RepID=UPI00053C0A99|nr:PREDICTED: protein terminal ear1 homolog [Tarenaya hassleriana]
MVPFPYNRQCYFHCPVLYYHNPFSFPSSSEFISEPPEPAAGETLKSFHRPPFGFRFLPPRLKRSGFCRDNEITIRLDGKTSLMIKNIPNIFGRKDLLKIIDDHCREKNIGRRVSDKIRSSYDFLYLPMDFMKRANLGYAFVNFTSSIAAVRFCRDFNKFHWPVPGNKKVCEITLAKFQGKDELTRHFSSSRFACHTNAYLPVVLLPPSDGFARYRLDLLGVRVGGAWTPPPTLRRHRR